MSTTTTPSTLSPILIAPYASMGAAMDVVRLYDVLDERAKGIVHAVVTSETDRSFSFAAMEVDAGWTLPKLTYEDLVLKLVPMSAAFVREWDHELCAGPAHVPQRWLAEVNSWSGKDWAEFELNWED